MHGDDKKMETKSKNLTKIFALVLFAVLIPIIVLFAGCGSTKTIESIEKTDSTGLVDTYTITYSDGTTYNFTITNGQDGDDASLDLTEIYNSAVAQGYAGTYIEFLSEVLSVNTDNSYAINKALLSSVSVYCDFTRTVGNMNIWTGEITYTEQAYNQVGSGVIYQLDKNNGSAYIITNYHVLYSADSNADKISQNIEIYLYGSSDTPITATYVGGSMTYDIAVLKVENSEFLKNSSAQAVEIAAANTISVGDSAIAVGNPEAQGISATQGIVSVDSEYVTMLAPDDKTVVTYRSMRIDTSINSGNSGGGLFNNFGQLMGIVNSKANSSSIENIAYAIPIDIAIPVADNIIYNAANGNGVLNLDLGLTVSGTDSKAVYDETTHTTQIVENATITEIASGSIAETLGLNAGDIITAITINDKTTEITRAYMVDDLMISARPNDQITIAFTREGANNTVSVTVSADNFVAVV